MLTRTVDELGINHEAPLVVAAATTDDAAALRVVIAAASRRGTEVFTHPALSQTEMERTRLEEAVRSYLATGSIAQSADQVFCHRNTLMNRLHRFIDLTGIDVTIPEQPPASSSASPSLFIEQT